MNNEREIQDEDLMDVAHDPEQAARLRKALKVLESNPNVGGKLQEMAKEVLSGRISMKDAIETRGYMDALGDRIDTIRQAAENQTPEEREEARQKYAAWQREQEAKEEAERAERDAPSRGLVTGSPRRGGPSHRR